MVKLIKFDLQINNQKITNLQELQAAFCVEIIPLFEDGRLSRFLKTRGLHEIAEKIDAIDTRSNELQLIAALGNALGVDGNEFAKEFLRKQKESEEIARRAQEAARKRKIRKLFPPGSMLRDGANYPEMVIIPEGSFLMGNEGESKEEKTFFENREKPIHRVNIESFAIGKYPITYKEWFYIMGDDYETPTPSDLAYNKIHMSYMWGENGLRYFDSNKWLLNNRKNYPITNACFWQIQNFIKRLNDKTGQKYRLPSEAEWEYAARGGSEDIFYFRLDDSFQGNYEETFFPKQNPIGGGKCNNFGIYNMFYGIREVCEDFWHPNYEDAPTNGSAWMDGGEEKFRIIRGGSELSFNTTFKEKHRRFVNENYGEDSTGFRLAKTLVIPS